jgi:3-oxoacyl-[acyl-carrier protein] reductase
MLRQLVLITGASSGIGQKIYNEYQKLDGYIVVGASRRGPDLRVDLEAINVNWDAFPRADILINCAGVLPEDDNLDQILQVNFKSCVSLIQSQLSSVKCVINIASVSGMVGEADFPNYAASKAALLSITASYARKYAPLGIRFNAISPGMFKTNLHEGDPPQWLLDKIPIKETSNLIEIFNACRFLELSRYTTGSNIVIDGGYTCKTL